MTLRIFNGIQIDVPDEWSDLSTIILAPKKDVKEGNKPSINLVVKRRPARGKDLEKTLTQYLAFMKESFGKLEDVEAKPMMVGSIKGKAVRFVTEAAGQRFRQITLLYQSGGDEISATVTQLLDDPTPPKQIEKLLKSIKPAAGGVFGIR
ncbi:MAG: DcrB-related protein [Myxococcales bacterium]|nr:DcrB-related protein [Myxococcales bacterium]MCB9648959.1 DcrB-related protein [Deltaproteobacteria bacterium]